MKKSRVALVPLNTYEQEAVDLAVRQGIELLGGMKRFVQTEEKVLLKPNLLGKAIPEKAITTHPAVFSAVARLMREEGYAHVSYGDSPGNPATTPDKAADACGIAAAAKKWKLDKADFDKGSLVHFPQGKTARSFYLCKGVQDCDALINVAKMKTHGLERITGAVKNLYGCVCGVNKATGHASYPNSEVFADMLCDLNLCVKPRLHILDGVVAMEGNGPASGTPKAMNVLLFSDDPVAMDSVFAALVHLDPKEVPTSVSGEKGGLGVMDQEAIEVVTLEGTLTVAQAQKRWGKADFDVFRGQIRKGLLFRVMPMLPFLQHRPKVDRKKCIACGICEEACPIPGKAVHSGKGKKAKYEYSKCIRCYCCQEMCPAKAIEVHHGMLNRLLRGK